MNNVIQVLIPGFLIIIAYALILTRKGEMQRAKVAFGGSHDWITLIGVAMAAVVLSHAMLDLNIHILNVWWYALAIPVFLIIVVIIKIMNGKAILNRLGDERTNAIRAKSGRNGLFATYLAFFIHILVTNTPSVDTKWVMIIIASGLGTLLASIFFYYYRKAP